MPVLRYLGLKKESTYGTLESTPSFYIDITEGNLDTPDDPNIKLAGGLSRFTRKVKPGVYIPEGSISGVCKISILYWLLWLFLGSKSTVDNTTSVSAEDISDISKETDYSLDNSPITPGSLVINDDTATELASDDSFGNITETGSSGVTGTVDYANGTINLDAITSVDNADYSHGSYEHTLTPANDSELNGFSALLGKDQFEHDFKGCAINSLTITAEKEWITFEAEVNAKEDEKGALKTRDNIKAKIPRDRNKAFHNLTIKNANKGSALTDISKDIQTITLNFNNNSDAEGGVTIGSRTPQRIWSGEFECSIDCDIVFDGTDEIEDFWGGSSAPSADGPTEKTIEITLNDGNYGDVTLTFNTCYYSNVEIQPSGKERLTQTANIQTKQNDNDTNILKAVVNSLYNWT